MTHLEKIPKSQGLETQVTHLRSFKNTAHLQNPCPNATKLLTNTVPTKWENSVPIELDHRTMLSTTAERSIKCLH